MSYFLTQTRLAITISKRKTGNARSDYGMIYKTDDFTKDLIYLANMSETLEEIDTDIENYIKYAKSSDYQFDQAKEDCNSILKKFDTYIHSCNTNQFLMTMHSHAF